MPSLMDRFYGAYRGFREPDLFADPTGYGSGGRGGGTSHGYGSGPGSDDAWGRYDARRNRYLLLWTLAQQQGYRDFVRGTAHNRATYGLYQGVRDLFGVAHQLNEFHTAHLQGGDLDPKAGDGKEAPSALPVLMDAEDPSVRQALAELWKRSNWPIMKDVVTRYGSATGDVFLEVCDDDLAQTVRLNVVAGGRVKWNDLTTEGNIEAYELEYARPDPRFKPENETLYGIRPGSVRYREIVQPEKNGGGYRWTTLLGDQPFDWPGNPTTPGRPGTWVIADLPFAPLVKIQHKNIGMGWGQAEAHAALTGSREAADLASCVTDWVRRASNAPHLMAGMSNPATDPRALAEAAARAPSLAQQRSGYGGEFASWGGGQSAAEAPVRGGENYLYTTNEQARATSLVHPFPVGDVGLHIDRVTAKNRDDYPELSFEKIRSSGDASAEAIREARKPAEAKVYSRRVEYDAGAARAFRMALTLGGLRGYRHYEGFDAGSYDEGRLDFRIGPRPAFAPDPVEEIAERQARYTAVKAAVDAGLPLGLAMREAGYSEEDVADAERQKAEAQQQAMEAAKVAPAKAPFGG